MNRLKPTFLSSFVFLTAVLGIHALIAVISEGLQAAWLGVLLSAASVLGFFLNLYRFRTPRTSPNLNLNLVLVVFGFILSAAGSVQSGPLPTLSGSFMLIGWLIYTFWYSRLVRDASQLTSIGRQLPVFELPNENGQLISSLSFLGNPAIYLFYRGNWCPICMAQIQELSAEYRQLSARGAQVVLISPQPQDRTRSLAQRFDVPFQFLVDESNELAARLGIDHNRGIPEGYQLLGYDSATVFPTVVITDSRGTIIFAHETDNYRVRPHPDEFIQILDQHLAADQSLEYAALEGPASPEPRSPKRLS